MTENVARCVPLGGTAGPLAALKLKALIPLDPIAKSTPLCARVSAEIDAQHDSISLEAIPLIWTLESERTA